jgi:hypothetical protein
MLIHLDNILSLILSSQCWLSLLPLPRRLPIMLTWYNQLATVTATETNLIPAELITIDEHVTTTANASLQFPHCYLNLLTSSVAIL